MNIVKTIFVVLFFVFFVFQVMAATDRASEAKDEQVQINAAQMPVEEVMVNSAEDIKTEVLPYVEKVAQKAAVTEPVVDASQAKILDAVKAAIKDRSKTTGSLDIYDGKAEKVRNLDLMDLQPTIGKDGDDQVVIGDFRDMKSGDVVTVEIKVAETNGAYDIKDTVITGAKAPEAAKEEKKDFTDAEIQSFMNEYVSTQAQTTGTFDLYDEKLAKMRNLELVKIDDKVRHYGIIGISTAEFKDKNSGDTVMVDVTTENKGGLSVTAMRIKGIAKTPAEAAK